MDSRGRVHDHPVTMKTLYLLRHAKSSWDDPSLADHERPLAPRGRKAARRIGAYLTEHGIEPELVLCSTAARTRETLAGLGSAIPDTTQVEAEKAVYGAGAWDLLRRVRRAPAGVVSLMVIGHNPGLEDLAGMLASGGDRLPALRAKFPTGALATLVFEGTWSDLEPGDAELTGFVTPREL